MRHSSANFVVGVCGVSLSIVGAAEIARAQSLAELEETYYVYLDACNDTGHAEYCEIARGLYDQILPYYGAEPSFDAAPADTGVGDLTPYTGYDPESYRQVWGNEGRINSFGLSGTSD